MKNILVALVLVCVASTSRADGLTIITVGVGISESGQAAPYDMAYGEALADCRHHLDRIKTLMAVTNCYFPCIIEETEIIGSNKNLHVEVHLRVTWRVTP